MAIKIVYQGLNGAVALDEQQNTTVSANYTVQPSDYIVTATGAGSFNITLPPAGLSNGKTILIKCLTTASITVNAYSGEFIDTVSSKTLLSGEVLEVISDGVKWVSTASDAISGSKIIDGTITNSKLSSNAVTDTKIASGAITESKIASNAVTETKIADNSITAAKIATGAVGNDEISTSSSPTVNTIYTNNWFRSNGTTGWYNQTYNGGIWMKDFNYVRIYGNNAFVPSNGNGTNGIMFPSNPGGGAGDYAYIQYYASSGEDTVLELKVQNDNNDRILLTAPAANFTVGQAYNGSASIQGYTVGEVEFRYASGGSTRYLRMQTDGNMVIYNEYGSTALWASGTQASDLKLKENINNYTDSGINAIKGLNVINFNYIKEYELSQVKRVGFIAQDVAKFIPQAVKSVGPDEKNQTLLLHKEEIIPYLVKAIQEQQEQIQSLEERIKKLEDLVKF